MRELVSIITDIRQELEKQEVKWGEQNHKQLYWLGILVEEVGEVAKALIEHRMNEELRKELIHTAAVTIHAIDSLDRNGE